MVLSGGRGDDLLPSSFQAVGFIQFFPVVGLKSPFSSCLSVLGQFLLLHLSTFIFMFSM